MIKKLNKTKAVAIILINILIICTIETIDAFPLQMTEKQKIEYLIQSIEKLDGAKFYRNGDWHTPKEAADHLRLKLENAGSRIKTAQQFIDKLASESSMSGLSYKIKFKDGTVVESKVFFYQQLSKLK
jgi:hypothetical protein